jgi:Ca2+-binding RTX toxin-like protein
MGGLGNDTLDGGAGSDWASWADMGSGVLADLADWTRSTGWAAQDRLWGIENLIGTGFGDTLLGDAGANRLWGAAGNDRLEGRGGADELDGGQGNDWLDAGAGADRLLGGDGHDSLYGGAGADSLWGGTGNDRLEGGDGDDQLTGGEGNDILLGGVGNDTMDGGGGSDVFVFAEGNDKILDFTSGSDKIWLVDDLWGSAPQTIATLLAGAEVSDGWVTLNFNSGMSLEIAGIFDPSVLADDILFM